MAGRGIGHSRSSLCGDHRLLRAAAPDLTMKRRIALISTGGTIEKTYDELRGVLSNQVSVLDIMLASLELRGVDIRRVQLMNKDSLDMSPDDHTLIAQIAGQLAQAHGGVVVVHGTDRLAVSGDRVVELVGT